MSRSRRHALTGLFAAFASLGVTASFVPAVLPAAEASIGADLSPAVPALFAGLLVGVLLSGPLMLRHPARTTLIIGSALQAVALVAGACADTAALFFVAAAIAGTGFGLVEASGAVTAKDVATGSATGVLSALTGTVAVSAAITPLAVSAGAGALPVLSALAAVPLTTILLLAIARTERREAAAPLPRKLGVLASLAPFAVALPLYVGIETVLSGWSAVIPERALLLSPATAALGTTAFWTLMALGRFGAAGLRRRGVPPIAILAGGTTGAAVLMGSAGLLVAAAPIGALIALAASVALLAPSYGLIVGLALDPLDTAQSAAVTGALVACGALGGTFVPALVLLIGRDPASSATLLVSAGLCAAVPVLTVLAVRHPFRVSAARTRPPR